MSEIGELVKAWTLANTKGEAVALATVVHVEGSAYRKPGARMLVTRDGVRVGSISGGCLESELTRRIWWLTELGPCVKRYSTSFDEDTGKTSGLGCEGTIDVLLERGVADGQAFRVLSTVNRERRADVLCSVIHSTHPTIRLGTLPATRHFTNSDDTHFADELEALVAAVLRARQPLPTELSIGQYKVGILGEYIVPPIGLVIFGTGEDVRPLVAMAIALGWRITLVEHRTSHPPINKFPQVTESVILPTASELRERLSLGPFDAVILMTHSYEQDSRLLRELLITHQPYIGVLGPRSRTMRILSDLGCADSPSSREHSSRLHSPIGFPLGGGGPCIYCAIYRGRDSCSISR